MNLDGLKAAIKGQHLFAAGDLVVVGVSGGPDSVALLHLLTGLSRTDGFRLHVAHLDHLLRGAESAADAQYVRELSGHLGWPVTIRAENVADLQQRRHLTLEEAGRVARYNLFCNVAKMTGAVGVALGHTADDQVETILLHWLRGAGPRGLRGMQPVVDLALGADNAGERQSLRIFRPFLSVNRSEIEDYCRVHSLQPRHDPSNRELRFRRNEVRWRLLPELRRLNPHFDDAVRRSARVAAAVDDHLAQETSSLWSSVAKEEDASVFFDLSAWRNIPEILQLYLLREGYARLEGDLLGLSAVHLAAAIEAVRDKPAGTTLHWPRGVRVLKRYADFGLCRGPRPESRLDVIGENLSVPGDTLVAQGQWSVEVRFGRARCHGQDPWHADLDHHAIGGPLAVRRLLPGDRLQPLGMHVTKKVQDLLVDAKVPREERDFLPVVTEGDNIVWLAGQRIAEWAKVTEQTQTVLCIRFRRRPE